MTDNQWSAPFRGEGKRPEGLADDAPVRCRSYGTVGHDYWLESAAKNCSWFDELEYQILQPTSTADSVEVLREALMMCRNSVGDLRKGFAPSVEPARWVEQLQDYIDAALTSTKREANG